MTRRFRWSAALTLPILAFMVAELIPGQPLHHLLPTGAMNWTQFLFATPIVLWDLRHVFVADGPLLAVRTV